MTRRLNAASRGLKLPDAVLFALFMVTSTAAQAGVFECTYRPHLTHQEPPRYEVFTLRFVRGTIVQGMVGIGAAEARVFEFAGGFYGSSDYSTGDEPATFSRWQSGRKWLGVPIWLSDVLRGGDPDSVAQSFNVEVLNASTAATQAVYHCNPMKNADPARSLLWR